MSITGKMGDIRARKPVASLNDAELLQAVRVMDGGSGHYEKSPAVRIVEQQRAERAHEREAARLAAIADADRVAMETEKHRGHFNAVDATPAECAQRLKELGFSQQLVRDMGLAPSFVPERRA